MPEAMPVAAFVVAEYLTPDRLEKLARRLGQTPEEFRAAVEAENRRHAARRAAYEAHVEAVRMERWHKLVGDRARPAPVRWECPQCGAVAVTTEANPRCDACGFRDDG